MIGVSNGASGGLASALLGPLLAPAALGPARDLLLGALTAVEGIKQLLDLGQPAELPANLFLLGDD